MMNQPMGMGGRQATGRQTADKLKERFGWLNSFSDEELREISYCNTDETMRSGESYFDISHPEQGIIEGHAGMPIPENCCYVPKSEIPRHLWDKLVGRYS